MNVGELLREVLSGHGPVYPDFYGGEEPKYLTFNFPDEVGALFGDNRPHFTLVYVQVHLYLPDKEPYQEEKMQICKELKAAGFGWPEVTILHERDIEKRHLIFETKIKRRIEEE